MTDADMIEAMARAIGPSFIGNRMPDMSGDPLRKATPYERRRIDEAVTAALAVVQPELDRLRALSASLAREGEDGELCKRLEATRDGIPFGWASSNGRSDVRTPKHLINPDGPEAAARIRALTAENEALRRERDEAHADAYTTDEDGESVTWQELCAAERAVRHHNKSRAESSEALVAELREKVERLRKALEPFAKAASDYERQGEFFSDNIELVLRVSVFAAPEYHNSTAVQVGDLRRACTALEGRDNG